MFVEGFRNSNIRGDVIRGATDSHGARVQCHEKAAAAVLATDVVSLSY